MLLLPLLHFLGSGFLAVVYNLICFFIGLLCGVSGTKPMFFQVIAIKFLNYRPQLMIERKAVCTVIFEDLLIARGRKSGVQAVIVGLDLGFTILALWAMLCPELLHSLPCLLGCDVVSRMGF
jgi:hypothetical protein